ncbi:hypothetical protein [uncultured Campylobacter sp.]|uniref:hypothetical protein n=1 Tax=uncultured Campylobacter sp. TaxID=218934 RepID=UPI0026102247|nr:hypothetical protein [uncultured Campylobacter sp.]
MKNKIYFITAAIILFAWIFYLYKEQSASCDIKDLFMGDTEITKECRIAIIKQFDKNGNPRAYKRLSLVYGKILSERPTEEVLDELDREEIEFLKKLYPDSEILSKELSNRK